jgi:hypothetical protein
MRPLIAIVFFAALLFVLTEVKSRRALRRYVKRACTGFHWKRQFPEASKNEIREFLNIFIEAFCFREKWRLRFTPEDRVLEVYHALYPVNGAPDSMELESFVEDLEKRYRVNIVGIWREDITLGDLFSETRRSSVS